LKKRYEPVSSGAFSVYPETAYGSVPVQAASRQIPTDPGMMRRKKDDG
jgi:hypothetical protein